MCQQALTVACTIYITFILITYNTSLRTFHLTVLISLTQSHSSRLLARSSASLFHICRIETSQNIINPNFLLWYSGRVFYLLFRTLGWTRASSSSSICINYAFHSHSHQSINIYEQCLKNGLMGSNINYLTF